jgi:hypothetical protein
VTPEPIPPPVQLLVYEFGPDADFEGRVGGALERIESGGALRLVDGLFVARDPDGGDLLALDLKGTGAGGFVAPLLEFRLNPASRRAATKRTLESAAGADWAETLRRLAAALEPGGALVALLVEHRWARALEEAVSRSGGSPLAGEFVEAGGLAELGADLIAAVERQ